jgi:hypothetical protein
MIASDDIRVQEQTTILLQRIANSRFEKPVFDILRETKDNAVRGYAALVIGAIWQVQGTDVSPQNLK